MPRPRPTLVLHMTRIERLASMVREGLLPDAECQRRQLGGVGIGYPDVKQRRARRRVPCGPGGTLADYVPWYFAPRSPMLYAIAKGQVSEEASHTEEIVYVTSSVEELRSRGLTVVVSNRHALLQLAAFSEHDAVLDGDDFVDWRVMTSTMWTNTDEHPDRKERRQAECLVHPAVPWSAVTSLSVKTELAAARVQEVVRDFGLTTPVHVRPHWYF